MQDELKSLLDKIASQPELSAEATDDMMSQAFAMAETPDERREAGAYLTAAISKRKRPDIDVREMLGDVAEALNL